MNNMQKQYHAFIESECTRLGCKDVIKPLQEGFAAMCEAIVDGWDESKPAGKCQRCGELSQDLYQGLCHDCLDWLSGNPDDDAWYEKQQDIAFAGLDKCAGCGCELEPGEADENGYCPDCSRYSDVCPSCGRKRPGLYPHLSDGFCQECERKTFGDGDPYAEEGIG